MLDVTVCPLYGTKNTRNTCKALREEGLMKSNQTRSTYPHESGYLT